MGADDYGVVGEGVEVVDRKTSEIFSHRQCGSSESEYISLTKNKSIGCSPSLG